MSGRFSLGWSRKPQGHVMRFNFPINTEDNLQRCAVMARSERRCLVCGVAVSALGGGYCKL